jgi:putative ABC transport system ATP-binding protein
MADAAGGSRIEVSAVVKDYARGRVAVRALAGVDLTIEAGQFVAITGRSGSGKSTLMHLLGALDRPSAGTVRVAGQDLSTLDDKAATAFRRDGVGFVFQFFNLLPTMRAWENVAVPGLLAGRRLPRLRTRAVELLARVGLADRVEHRPAELSGGQLQRVALARSLFLDPPLLLADEPTGNLDSHSGADVLDLLGALARDDGRTVVMVTHDAGAAGSADRVVTLADGVVARDA